MNYFFLLMMFMSLDYQGLFYIVESSFNFYFFYLSLVSYYLIKLLTNNEMMIFLSKMLVLFSFLFFFTWSMLFFFIFFELSSFPVILMTLIFGIQVEKMSSIYYLVFYSFMTGFPFMFFLLYVFKKDNFFNLVFFDMKVNYFFLTFVCLGFLMKFPVYFLHFWLPKVHVEAPTLASMLLAGLLLKFGVIGFFRIFMLFKVEEMVIFYLVIFMGIMMGMMMSLIQSDMKSQVAFSSICHMSFTLLSFMYYSDMSMTSVVFSSLSHGFLSTLMFWFIGEIYYLSGTRLMYYSGSGMMSDSSFSLFFSILNFLSSSIPLGLGYFSEFNFFLNYMMLDFMFLFLSLYFLMDFYMSVYMLIMIYIGKGFKGFFSFVLTIPLSLILMSVNFFSFM